MRRFILAILLVLATCLGACGATTVVTVPAGQPTTAPTTIAGHACTKQDTAMQCQLPPANQRLTQATAPAIAWGIDFAWGAPSVNFLRSIGATFGASYFSYDSGKNWTAARVAAYHAAGIATVGVWETTANRATQGFSAGFNDAFAARRQARGVGEPDNRPIDFAVDCDCSVSSIFYYFGGAVAGTQSMLHIGRAQAVQLVNAYGGYYQIRGLYLNHVVGHTNWQTYAWSRGLWLPASIAPLEQYLNGNAFDHDRAIAKDYGQWPFSGTPTGPTQPQIANWRKGRDASLVAYHNWKCQRPVLVRHARCGTYAQRVLRFQSKLNVVHKPRCWGPGAQVQAPVCQVARPAVSIWSQARDASYRVFVRQGCTGIATFGVEPRTKACNTFRHRRDYFSNRATALFKLYT